MKSLLKLFLGNDDNEHKSEKIEGYIEYFGLKNWWLSDFSEEERKKIVTVLGHTWENNPLTRGSLNSAYMSATASKYLSNLASWFNGPENRDIARKFLEKAQELNQEQKDTSINIKNVLDEHFTLSEMILVYYRDRDIITGMLEKAIDACKKQISLAPSAAKEFLSEYPGQSLPSHRGYEQLVIILEKQGKLDEAIQLSKQALHEGWSGDWEKRIDRYSNKLKK